MTANSPHAGAPVLSAGVSLDRAAGALILLHGRGATPADILGLGQQLSTGGLALLAPAAAGGSWYPHSFLAPRRLNEPYLSSALETVDRVVHHLLDAGLPADRIALCGFSQGACLASEFVARQPRRYGALLAYTGGLIGPLEDPINLSGDLAGTPVLLSSGDPDPHVPWSRVQQTADLLGALGAEVRVSRYPGRPHTVLPAEIDAGRAVLAGLSAP